MSLRAEAVFVSDFVFLKCDQTNRKWVVFGEIHFWSEGCAELSAQYSARK